jgi:hypothetical protein
MNPFYVSDKWTGFAPEHCRGNAIRRIPCERARVVVMIDGRPYAGCVDRATAETAVKLWRGEINGGGFPVAHDCERCGWQAARGRELAVIER